MGRRCLAPDLKGPMNHACMDVWMARESVGCLTIESEFEVDRLAVGSWQAANQTTGVIAGLVPAIHERLRRRQSYERASSRHRMGTRSSPGVTFEGGATARMPASDLVTAW